MFKILFVLLLTSNDFVQKVGATVHENKTFSDYYNADAAQYAALISLMADILERGGEAKDEELAALEEFRKLTSETGVRATGFVRQLTGKGDYYEPIYVADDEESYKLASDNQVSSPVKVYPNPSNGQVTIEYSLQATTSDAQLLISDMLGREIFRLKLAPASEKAVVNIPNDTQGIYFFKLQENGNTTFSGKLTLLN